MNWMKRHLIYINMVWALLLGSCTSESGTGTPDVNPVVPSKPTNNTETAVTQDEILLQVVEKEAETRALGTQSTTYDNYSSLVTEASFRMNAYYHGTTTTYINNSKVRYWAPSAPHYWRFCDDGDNLKRYFWPPIDNQTNANPDYKYLDFFAYLPATKPAYITSDIGYSTSNGPTFTCSLPLTDSGQSGIKEFMYGLAPNLTKTDGEVAFSFQHPFARIIIALTRAKLGMTLNSVTFNNIRYNETFTHGNTPKWTSSGSTSNFVMTVDKTMGTDLPNGVIGGPYLVVPQAFAGSTQTITLNVTYDPWATEAPTSSSGITYTKDNSDPTNKTYNIAVAITRDSWNAAGSYTYSIDLGEDDNTVTIGVTVQEWDNKGDHTTITVE